VSSDPDDRSIARLLDNPAVWAEVPPGLKDRVLAEALRTAPAEHTGVQLPDRPERPGRPDEGVVTPLQGRPRHAARGARPVGPPLWQRPVLLAAAAVALVGIAIGGTLVATQDDTLPAGTEVALAGSENMPDASGDVVLREEPSGFSVTLNVAGLPPAPERTFYEAWVVSEERGKVSAGTFHIREPQDDITLWLGVDPAGYDAITVTRQPVDGGTLADGVLMLRGELP
jgi:hypothetical protein